MNAEVRFTIKKGDKLTEEVWLEVFHWEFHDKFFKISFYDDYEKTYRHEVAKPWDVIQQLEIITKNKNAY